MNFRGRQRFQKDDLHEPDWLACRTQMAPIGQDCSGRKRVIGVRGRSSGFAPPSRVVASGWVVECFLGRLLLFSLLSKPNELNPIVI